MVLVTSGTKLLPYRALQTANAGNGAGPTVTDVRNYPNNPTDAASALLLVNSRGEGSGYRRWPSLLKALKWVGTVAAAGGVVYAASSLLFRNSAAASGVSTPQLFPPQAVSGLAQIFNYSGLLNGSDSAPRDDGIVNITRAVAVSFLEKLIIDDIDAGVLARGAGIAEHYPEIYAIIEQSRTELVQALYDFKDNSQNSDFPLPSMNQGHAARIIKKLIKFMLADTPLDYARRQQAIEGIFRHLLAEMEISAQAFDQKQSYIAGNTTLIDLMIDIAETPCYSANATGKCLEFIYIEQTAAGIEKDRLDKRPPTYAAIVHPVAGLLGDKYPVIFTSHLANLTDYLIIVKHALAHELIHYAGFKDLLYTGVDLAVLSADPTAAEETYAATLRDFRSNVDKQIDAIPLPMKFLLADFYDKTLGAKNGMADIPLAIKFNQLKQQLKTDDQLWQQFENECTDLIAMRIITTSMQNRTLS